MNVRVAGLGAGGGNWVDGFPGLAIADPGLTISVSCRIETVGDLRREVLAINHSRLMSEIGGWNPPEVWESLCRVIVRQTGVERGLVMPESRIVDDLGIQ